MTLAYIGNRLDRCANQRNDATWLAAQRASAHARIVHINGDGTLLFNGRLETTRPAEGDLAVFLGRDESGAPWFACKSAISEGLTDLRSIAMENMLPDEEIGILAQARALIHWHERRAFCSNCGGRNESVDAGYRRHCNACGADHFPRTDPVIIIAVRHKARMLLGRQSAWPDGMYSTLAGFMEPGETIEEAARREVFEEAGIRVGDIRFHLNQPWPFPSSLMIGLIGEALNDDIVIDPKELETARWFEEQEVRAMLDGRHAQGLKAPQPLAIAHHLIRASLQSS